MARYSEGFARGLQTCANMLEALDMDECALVAVTEDIREGRPQDNAVRRTLEEVLKRGNAEELDGFCAALTDVVASADGENSGYWQRGLTELAEKRSGPA